MHAWQGSWPAGLLAAVGAGLLVLSLIAWRRRVLPTARRLAVLFLSAAVWAIADALGTTVTTLGVKVALSKVETLAALAVVMCWLLVVRSFAGRPRLRPVRLVLLLVVPLALLPFILFNWRGAVWPSVTLLHTAAGAQARYTYGPILWVELGYACLLGSLGLVWLAPALRSGSSAHRRQAFILAAVALLPFFGSAFDFAGWNPFVQDIDLAPLTFGAGIVLLGWSLLREGFLEVAPLARDALLRTLPDAVLIVDHERRLIEANPAATAILGLSDGDVPRPLEEALAGWPTLLAACAQPAEACEVLLAGADGERRFEVRSMALRDVAGREQGRLITLHDVTTRARAVAHLRTQTARLAALLEADRAIAGSLDYDEVLRRIAAQARLGLGASRALLYEQLDEDALELRACDDDPALGLPDARAAHRPGARLPAGELPLEGQLHDPGLVVCPDALAPLDPYPGRGGARPCCSFRCGTATARSVASPASAAPAATSTTRTWPSPPALASARRSPWPTPGSTNASVTCTWAT